MHDSLPMLTALPLAAGAFEWIHAVVIAGFVAGLVHVVTGVDHMAALLPLSVNLKGRAAWLGVRWGLGHGTGVILVAVAAIYLSGLVFTQEAIESWGADWESGLGGWAERLVGVMLIVIGALGLRAALRKHIHTHEHDHGDEGAHVHLHVHADGSAHGHGAPESEERKHEHRLAHTAFFAGVLHGLAGPAHVLAVMPAIALSIGKADPSKTEAWAYLICFAVGTIAAMAAFAALVGLSTAAMGASAPRRIKAFMVTASCLCMAVGVAWIALPLMGIELP